MQILFRCPACQQMARSDLSQPAGELRCQPCNWSRTVEPAEMDGDGQPLRCLVCGCDDLWRQKDFSQKLGLAIVGIGIVLSTIAWAWFYPLIAIGILMAFALLDLVLYAVMSDVLVCYRCGGRHRQAVTGERHAGFNLETAERHRQEAARLAGTK